MGDGLGGGRKDALNTLFPLPAPPPPAKRKRWLRANKMIGGGGE